MKKYAVKVISAIVVMLMLCCALLCLLMHIRPPKPKEEYVTPIYNENQATLILYFSLRGHSEQLAKNVQQLTNADLAPIVPAEPYDTDPRKMDQRIMREMKQMSHPEIGKPIERLDQYQRIILIYPQIWGQPPMIIATLFNEYNLKDKKIYPITTGGRRASEGLDPLLQNLSNQAGSNLMKDFSYREDQEKLVQYLKEMELIEEN